MPNRRGDANRRTFPWFMLCIAILDAACSFDPYATTVGVIRLTISGLPDSVSPAVTMTGPTSGGHHPFQGGSQFVSSLRPGRYTFTAAPVANTETRWVPTPGVQSISVRAENQVKELTIAYAPATSRLAVAVSGLPPGAAAITLTGPAGFVRTISGTQVFDLLDPGTYTISAPEVVSGGTTRRATPASGSITLTPSEAATAYTVAYGTTAGDLTINAPGLPVGAVALVTVTGAGGFSREIHAPATLTDLAPGTYTVSARVASSGAGTVIHSPSPLSQTATVTSTAATSVSITWSALQLGLDLVASNLAKPIFLTTPTGDQRLFIVERAGRIRVMRGGQLLATPFLDITPRVRTDLDRGLLSMAFDPSYATNGFFYVYFTSLNGDITVERYAAAAGSDVADPAATPVIAIPPRRTDSGHHGGLVMFGPDGMLYLATGDGGGDADELGNAQNPGVLLGKMLRIDVRTLPYTIPPTNPFVGQTGKRPEIWAMGLHNPWRFDFSSPQDGSTPRLVIADYASNTGGEINVTSAAEGGINYGWNIMNGDECFVAPGCNQAGLTPPVLANPPIGGTTIGGFVYRGTALPELIGHYFFSSLSQGYLASLNGDRATGFVSRLWNVPRLIGMYSFGEDAAGELYMIQSDEGKIFRIVRR